MKIRQGKIIGSLCALALLLSACSMPGRSEETAREGTSSAGEEGIVKELGDSDFKQTVLTDKKTSIVDFYTTWCGPCRHMAPIMEQLSSEYKGRVSFYKVDVEKNQEIGRKYMVESIPAFKIFKDGQIVYEKVGFTPPQVLREELDKVLK